MAKDNVSPYRAVFHLRKGGLHKALGISPSETIPSDKLESAKNSGNEHLRKMAQFAINAKKFKH